MTKLKKTVTITLITSLLLLLALNAASIAVAQNQGTVTILGSVGGNTTPGAGTYSYPDGSTQSFTATPDAEFLFNGWIVSTTSGSSMSNSNPLSLPMIAGVTYEIQPNFIPLQPAPGSNNLPTTMVNAAVVVVLASAGGSVQPPPGTYAFDNATSFNLTATPDSGWQFSHWVISGPLDDHGGFPFTPTPTDNPYNVEHGYGATYNYQPVFNPTGSTEPTPTGGATATPTDGGGIGGLSMEWIIIIGLVVVIIVILIAFGVFAGRRRH